MFLVGLTEKRQWQSLAMALGLEALLAVVVLGWVFQHMPTMPPELIPLHIETIRDSPPDKPITPEPPRKASVQPSPQPAIRARQDVPQAATQHAVPSESPAVQTVKNESASPTAPAHTPPVTSPSVDPALAYNVKLAAAVQAAFEVPGSAKALSFKGKARVEFTLHDGVASSIRVVQGSGLGAVDRAAVKAVESAIFPAPPAELKNKAGTYQIWVACF